MTHETMNHYLKQVRHILNSVLVLGGFSGAQKVAGAGHRRRSSPSQLPQFLQSSTALTTVCPGRVRWNCRRNTQSEERWCYALCSTRRS